jgi:ABC-type multidrug transport system ATPase subunit
LGFSATDLRLYPSLSASEHLRFAATMRALTHFEGLLEKVGLEQSADQPAATFSTGMRARLKLALAIMGSPRVLMLDEPGAGLDDEGRTLLAEVIAEQLARGSLVLATNDPAERRFGDYELVLGV